MARGEAPVDEAVFAKSVADLGTVAGMIVEGFMLEGTPPGSAALPEIWSNRDDFNEKVATLTSGVDALVAAVADGGFEAGQELALDMGGNCGGCHRNYRRRDE